MYATTITLFCRLEGPAGRTYQDGALVNDNGDVLWRCGHSHVVTVYDVISQSAQDCAEYERRKRMGRY